MIDLSTADSGADVRMTTFYIGHGDSMFGGASGQRWMDIVLAGLDVRWPNQWYLWDTTQGGLAPAQIADRVEAMPAAWEPLRHIVWLGAPDGGASADQIAERYLADVDRAVAAIGHDDFILLGAHSADGAQFHLGEPLGDAIVAINEALDATYSDQFLDVQAALLAASDGSPEDEAAVALGITPPSVRSDGIHLSVKGHEVVADAVEAHMAEAGLGAYGWALFKSGEDTFTFEDEDSVILTPFDDYIEGSNGAEMIDGGAGNDEIRARGGDDWIRDFEGDNLIWADEANLYDDPDAAGDDRIVTGDGDDYIFAGPGVDVIMTGGGADTIGFYAWSGRDYVMDFDPLTDRVEAAYLGGSIGAFIASAREDQDHGIDYLVLTTMAEPHGELWLAGLTLDDVSALVFI